MSDYTWCAALPDHAVDEILGALHDCAAGSLRPPLEAELWRRHAVPITKWPTAAIADLHPNITLALICGARGYTKTGAPANSWVDVVCAPGEDRRVYLQRLRDSLRARRGDDPEHWPVSRLVHNRIDQVECSCGYRGYGKLWRSSQTWWWPTELVDGIPHYITCKYACGVDDPCHAPNAIGTPAWATRTDIHCICGYVSSEHAERRLLPAY